MTVALISIAPLAILQTSANAGDRFLVPGVGDVYGARVGNTWGNYKIANVSNVGTPINQFSQLVSEIMSLNGDVLTITKTYTQRSPTSTELLAYAASKQAALALNGTMLGNTPIPTDTTTLILLSMAYTKSIATPGFTMPWLVPSVSPDNPTHLNAITLNATNIQNAAQQVGVFLADTLARKANAVAAINAGTATTTDDIDVFFGSLSPDV